MRLINCRAGEVTYLIYIAEQREVIEQIPH